MTVTSDFDETLEGADLVILAVPSHALRSAVQNARSAIEKTSPEVNFLIAAKGVEVETLSPMAEVVESELPARLRAGVCALGGPSFAAEVARQKPTVVVVGSSNPARGRWVQHALAGEALRVYLSDDLLGVELGGAFKNVIALACGMIDGAGLGLNARAALITRGLHEMTRLAVELGAHPATLSGLAGLGDLVLTCTGELSRNRRVGVALGQGRQLAEVLEEMGMVAEGVRNAQSALRLAESHGVEMPIVKTVHAMLYEGLALQEAVASLMGRELKPERH